MTTTELHDRITQRIDELDAMERAAQFQAPVTLNTRTPGPRIFKGHIGVASFGMVEDAKVFVEARNLLPGVLNLLRSQAQLWHSFPDNEVAENQLIAIARALGIEVEP